MLSFLRRGGLEVEGGCCFGKIVLAGGVIWGSGRGLVRLPEHHFGRRAEPKKEEEAIRRGKGLLNVL